MPLVKYRLGDITFNSLQRDADGVLWFCDELEGWDGAPIRLETSPNKVKDGQYVDSHEVDGRPLVLRGRAICPTEGAHWLARDHLSAAVTLIGEENAETLYVDEPNVPKQADVILNAKLNARRSAEAPLVLEYEVPLLAWDPRKYSQELHFVPLGAPPANLGTHPTPAIITINNYNSPPQITNHKVAKTIKFKADTPIGGSLVIDLMDETVYRNGAPAYTTLDPITNFWMIEPGLNNVQYVTGGGNGGYSFRDAWI